MENVVGFCACRSNTGKTTLMLRVLRELRRRDIPTAVLKHGRHGDAPEGKDSERYASTGAAASLFSAPEGWVLESRTGGELSFARAVALLRELTGCRIVLVEGYKRERFPKIAVCRRDVCLDLPCPENELAAVVCDVPLPCALPQFSFDDLTGLCDFLLTL